MSNEYFVLLKSPQWQEKRLERLNIANWECENCGDKSNQLHVHHRQYFKGKKPWEYENEQLEVLCETCHESAHAMIEMTKQILSYSNHSDIFNLLIGYSDEEIISKVSDHCNKERNEQVRATGYIAKMLNFVDSKKYFGFCNDIVANASNPTDAQQIFRSKYDNKLGNL